MQFNKYVISIMYSIAHEGLTKGTFIKQGLVETVNMITETNTMQFKYGNCHRRNTNNMHWEFKEGRNYIQFRRWNISIMKSHLK